MPASTTPLAERSASASASATSDLARGHHIFEGTPWQQGLRCACAMPSCVRLGPHWCCGIRCHNCSWPLRAHCLRATRTTQIPGAAATPIRQPSDIALFSAERQRTWPRLDSLGAYLTTVQALDRWLLLSSLDVVRAPFVRLFFPTTASL